MESEYRVSNTSTKHGANVVSFFMARGLIHLLERCASAEEADGELKRILAANPDPFSLAQPQKIVPDGSESAVRSRGNPWPRDSY